MKITEDIIKALRNCIDGVGSISDFSQQVNINIETVSKYLTRKTKSIQEDSWNKIYPLLQPYLSKSDSESDAKMKRMKASDYSELCTDQKILLDAFCALPKKMQEEQVLKIVELARKQVHETKHEA